ncbi:BatD family protein [Aliidiomarina iranensis]|nr:BatD family protein [Aliidiomarina iranensis]
MKRIITLIIFFWISMPSYAQQATASIDRNPVVEFGALVLTVTTDESLPRNAFIPERWISDFEIRGTSVNSSSTMVNNRVSRSIEWRVSLRAPAAGRYEIPAIQIGNSETAPIQVDVIAASEQPPQERNYFIEAVLDEESAYVQQQLTYTVKLYIADQLETGSLGLPSIDNVSVEQLGQDRQSQEIIDGRRFQVLTRTYGITPRRSGSITIPGVRFDGQVRRMPSSGFSALGRIEPVSTRSGDITIEVLPRPSNYVGTWLPSEQVSIEEQWEPESSSFTIGEPITRRVAITAVGVRPEQLPEPEFAYPSEIRVYPDRGQTEVNVIRGKSVARATYTTALVPSSAGEFILPAIEIPWWNTRTSEIEYAQLPERIIRVLAPPGGLTVPGTMQSPSEGELGQPNNASSGNGDSEVISAESQVTIARYAQMLSYWQYATFALFILWIATVILFLRQKHVKVSKNTQEPVPQQVRKPLHELKQACRTNDPSKARSAILAWHHARTGEPARGLYAIAKVLASPELEVQMQKLEAALYSREQQEWQSGKALWAEIQKLHQRQSSSEEVLPKLYPNS